MTDRTTITIGGEAMSVERVSALKASRAFALLKTIGKSIPELTKAYGEYRSGYARDHYVEVSRTQARLRWPPSPLIDPDTRAPVREPDEVKGPEGDLVPNPRAGELVVVPSPLDHMTEQDWTASGNVIRLPEEPGVEESIAAIFPMALELAEESVYRLLALLTLGNEEVYRAWKDGGRPRVDELVGERVDKLLGQGYADELLELAVVCGETVDEQFRSKAAELGDRVGKALTLVGLDPARIQRAMAASSPPPTPSPDSTPSSSTDGPASTDGAPTPSSEHLSTSSPSSPPLSATSAP